LTMLGSAMAQSAYAEFIGMTLFVFIGPASAVAFGDGNSPDVLQVALTFGLAIFVLAVTIGHHSGGQMNCAVTWALVLTGDIKPIQGLVNFAAQMAGATCGAFMLAAVYPSDATGTLGCNVLADGINWYNALIGEIFMTFLLLFVVYETAVNPNVDKHNTCLAIGMAVFLAHSVLIPVDGCSINPTRSFGPALVHTILGGNPNVWEDQWIFWAGPLIGATIAALMTRFWWHPGNLTEEALEELSAGEDKTAQPQTPDDTAAGPTGPMPETAVGMSQAPWGDPAFDPEQDPPVCSRPPTTMPSESTMPLEEQPTAHAACEESGQPRVCG